MCISFIHFILFFFFYILSKIYLFKTFHHLPIRVHRRVCLHQLPALVCLRLAEPMTLLQLANSLKLRLNMPARKKNNKIYENQIEIKTKQKKTNTKMRYKVSGVNKFGFCFTGNNFHQLRAQTRLKLKKEKNIYSMLPLKID